MSNGFYGGAGSIPMLHDLAPSSHQLKNATYSSDFDLQIPDNRRKTMDETMWLVGAAANRPQSQPAPPRSSTPAKTRSKPNPNPIENNALLDLVKRQEMLLAFYQQKYPNAALSQFLESYNQKHGDNMFDTNNWSRLSPVWKAYDEKLKELEQRELENVSKDRDRLFQQQESIKSKHGSTMEMLQAKVKLLAEENSLLMDQNRKNESLIQQAFGLQRAQEQLDHTVRKLREELETLQGAYERTMSDKSQLEANLARLQGSYQKLLVENETNARMLRSVRSSLVEADGRATRNEAENARLRGDVDAAMRWCFRVAMPVIRDYQRCAEALSITLPARDGDDPNNGNLLFEPPILASASLSAEQHLAGVVSICSRLEDPLRKLLRGEREAKQALELARQQLLKTEKEYTSLMHEIQMQNEQNQAELVTSKTYIERLISLAEKSKQEKELSYDHARKIDLENAKLKENLHRTQIESQEQMEQVLQQTREKLRKLESQYESDKESLEQELGGLKQAKMELQCEVGILLRDKRAVEDELKQVFRDWDHARNSFYSALKAEDCCVKEMISRSRRSSPTRNAKD